MLVFAARGTGALHKIGDIIRKEHQVEISKRQLKMLAWKLKLEHKLMGIDPRHTIRLANNYLREFVDLDQNV